MASKFVTTMLIVLGISAGMVIGVLAAVYGQYAQEYGILTNDQYMRLTYTPENDFIERNIRLWAAEGECQGILTQDLVCVMGAA